MQVWRGSTAQSRQRRGIITIEVLAVMPCLLIFAVSLAEFSMALRLNHKVAFSSRFGAKLASEQPRFGTTSLATCNQSQTVDNLKARIDRWLVGSNLTPSAAVLLEHNACGVDAPLQLQSAAGVQIDDLQELPALPVAQPELNVAYVRVTVWLPVVGNVPNALKTFGLDWQGALLRHSTVFRLESDNAFPEPVISVMEDSLPEGVTVAAVSQDSGAAQFQVGLHRSGRTTLTMTAAASHDRETPRQQLKYRWTSTGRSVGNANGREFRMVLDRPTNGSRQLLQVGLDVTDDCGCSSRLEIPVEVLAGDDLPLTPIPETGN
ncbi:hypothetical protein GC163_17875 [bacterium]|nr:hypothetical protein [bacterium]